MKKKLMALPLLLALMVAVTACGKEDPYEVLQKADANLAQVESIEMQVKGAVSVKMDPIAVGPIDMTFDVKAQKVDENKTNVAMVLSEFPMLPELSNMAVYYTDGYLYLNLMGEKMKMPLPIEGVEETEKEDAEESGFLFTFPKERMKDLKMEKGEGGDRIITFNIDMSEEIQAAMEANPEQKEQLEALGGEVTWTPIPFSFTVSKDDQMKAFSMSMAFSMTAEGQKMDMEIPLSFTITKTGEDVNIEFPDFSDYQETSMEEMNQAFGTTDPGQL